MDLSMTTPRNRGNGHSANRTTYEKWDWNIGLRRQTDHTDFIIGKTSIATLPTGSNTRL